MDKRTVVMLVDKIRDAFATTDITRNDLEGNSESQTLRLKASMNKIVQVITLYTSPSDFERNIMKHTNDIVFPMYYGTAQPASKGIVPCLCEAQNITYVGADAYAQIICNDKALSKQYAANFDILSPSGSVLRRPVKRVDVVKSLVHLELPLVVKPNFGGGSSGISEKSIVYSYDEAADLAMLLYKHHPLPILVEEYIKGYEVELILAGTRKSVKLCEEVQLLMGGKEYFQTEVWGFETKEIDDSSVDFRLSHYINDADRQRMLNLFASFEKMEIMRIDGRVNNGKFYLIELSPDCYLGDDCAVYYAFQHNGFTHSEMFEFLIENAQDPC